MSSQSKQIDFHKEAKERHGSIGLTAKFAGKSTVFVSKALELEARKHWKSTKRIKIIANRVFKLMDYVRQYDEAQLAEELAEQEA